MAGRVLVDTGPIAALLDRRDVHHAWASEQLARLHEPLVTCDAVLSEAFFLLASVPRGTTTLIGLLREQLVRVDPNFSFARQSLEILRSIKRYRNIPMSLADACLVRMSELDQRSLIFTTDRDFLSYRKNRRERIPLIAPF